MTKRIEFTVTVGPDLDAEIHHRLMAHFMDRAKSAYPSAETFFGHTTVNSALREGLPVKNDYVFVARFPGEDGLRRRQFAQEAAAICANISNCRMATSEPFDDGVPKPQAPRM